MDHPKSAKAPGDSARTVDELPLTERLRPDQPTVKKLIGFNVLYVGLLAFFSTAGKQILNIEVTAPTAVGVFIPTIFILAFIFETMDAAAGMGFGTVLAPTLFAMGYNPLTVIPALLVSQMLAGFVAGGMHKEFKNADYALSWPPNEDTKLVGIIAGVGIVAVVGSVVLTYSALTLSESLIKTYVAILVIGMGVFGLVRQFLTRRSEYRPTRMLGFAALAGFNKGLGGGGYGPVVTLGEIYSGVYEKSAVAITTMAEAVVTVAGAATFFGLQMTGTQLNLMLLPSLVGGSLLAGVAAPYTVRVVPNRIFRYIIPTYAVIIGALVTAKLYLL